MLAVKYHTAFVVTLWITAAFFAFYRLTQIALLGALAPLMPDLCRLLVSLRMVAWR